MMQTSAGSRCHVYLLPFACCPRVKCAAACASQMKKQALEVGKVVHADLVKTIVDSTGPSSEHERQKVDSLFHMVANGDEAGVTEHLSVDGLNTDPASKDYAGQTPLH
eukprot:6199130-Pleurochrysis_carterae.AAC.1